MKHFGQLKVLLWKNVLIRRRTLVYTTLEALVPFFYTVSFFMVRYYTPNNLRFLPAYMEDTVIQQPFQSTKTTVIGYAPKCVASETLMNRLKDMLLSKPWFNQSVPIKMLGFKSEFYMMYFSEKHPDFLYFAYAFDRMTNATTEVPENLSLILRVPSDKALQGHKDVFLIEANLLQILMEVFIDYWSHRKVNISVELKEFTVAMVSRKDSFLLKDMYRVALIIVGLTAYLVWRNVHIIALERENRILILIQQMGVNPLIYWLSWFITTLVCNVLICVSFSVPLFMRVFDREPVLKSSDSSLVVIYFFAAGFALSSYCILGSVLFKRAETCSAVASIIYVLVTFPAIETKKRSDEIYVASMIFTSVNLLLAFTHIGQMEHHGIGYKWNMKASLRNPEHFIWSLFFSGFIYLIITWLVYNIKIYHRAPWFAFKNITTCFKNYSYKPIQRDGKTYSNISVRVEKLCVNAGRKLTDITMIMLEDTITVLTGKELSGKGTFMSVMKGEITPSSGTVKVYGLDIVNDSLSVKLITGICPREQTAFFSSLTVLENLQFFATLKHLCQEKKLTNPLKLAVEFELESILNERVASLCASDKRVLQVALAFVGENKVVLLENPSLNMDIRTKFSLWSIIRDKAYGKTIVLNTNGMDEVEMSSDRIAVFQDGELKCCGTMQYINLYLDLGYHLTIEKDGSNCKESRIEYMVYNLIADSGLVEDLEQFMTFWLPMKTTESFHSLLSLLSNHRAKLGIKGFVVNATTLQDAIINLGDKSTMGSEFIRIPQVDHNLVPTLSDASVCNIRVRDKLNEMLNEPDTSLPDDLKKTRKLKTNVQILDTLIGSFSTDSFLIHAILKSMAKFKYSGQQLAWSQFVALFKKKLIYSTALLHVELFQVLILIMLSYWIAAPLGEQYCNMNECAQSTNFNTTLCTSVPISQGERPTNVSKILVNNYKNLFKYSHVKVLEYNITGVHFPFQKFVSLINIRPVVGVDFNVSEDGNMLNAIAYYAPRDVDLGPTVLRSLSGVMNAILQYLTNSTRYGIHPSTQPRVINTLVITHVSGNMAELQANRFSHHASVLNAVSLLMVPFYPVLERLTGSKTMQMLSGTKPLLYWSTSFLFDYLTYIFLCNTYSMSSAKIGGQESSDLKYSLMLLYTCNGIMMITYVYAVQSVFKSPSTAVGFMMIFNYILGNPSSTFVNFKDNDERISVKSLLTAIFFMAPPHILPQSVYHLILQSRARMFCKDYTQFCKYPENINYRADCCQDVCMATNKCLDHKGSSGFFSFLQDLHFQLWAMLFHTFFWSGILTLVEYKCFRKSPKIHKLKKYFRKAKDSRQAFYGSQVSGSMCYSKRRQSVAYVNVRHKSSTIAPNLPNTTDVTSYSRILGARSIVFVNVDKKVNDEVIVQDISLKIEEGDVFCLAGSDLVAPSTIVEMICGLQNPTSGEIYIHGQKLSSRRPSVPQIGYCSNETSGLMPMLTGEETLFLFARLRGVAQCHLKRLVEIYLNAFHLESVGNKHASNYSDCERRRLSIAAALIGEPPICLLCDPMYKLDSESREAVWRWLQKLKNINKTIIIATDQLQEISKHAANIMILVDGSQVCVGTAKAIEAICCKGYTLFAKLDPKNAAGSINLFYSMLREQFPNCQLFHGNQDLLHFHIPYEDDRIADIFSTLENIKKQVKVESYRVNKTNLDQVQIATQNAYFVHGIDTKMQGQGDDNSSE